MNDLSLSANQPETESERFYSAAYLRIIRFSIVLLPCLTIVFWFALDHGFALGWLAGGVVSIVNFLSLKKLVIAFADRVIASGGAQRSSGLVLRFLLRYGLVAAVAYGIFRSSAMSAYGLLAGLILPALAIMIEAGYELSMYLRRGY